MKPRLSQLIGWAAALLIAAGPTSSLTGARAQTGNPGGAINDHLGDMDYGVCRGTDPKCFHDWPRAKTTD